MKLKAFAVSLLLLFTFAMTSFTQDKPDVENKNTDSEADEYLKNSITKEEGKKIFERLSDEKKKKIIQRWEELKKLPEEQRKKALENFYRLLNAELKNMEDSAKKNENKDDASRFKNIQPETILANILHMSFFHIQKNRNEKHMHLVYSIHKDDPYFFYKLKSLSKEEQFKRLLQKRDELFEKDVDEIAKNIALDDEKKKKLKKLLKKHRDEEDKIEMKFVEKQVQIWEQAHKEISSNNVLFGLLKQFIHVFKSVKSHTPLKRKGWNKKGFRNR